MLIDNSLRLTNPFFCQALSLTAALVLIMLPFSELYGPPGQRATLIILYVIILSIILGVVFNILCKYRNTIVTKFDTQLSLYDRVLLRAFVGAALIEFVVCGVPLLGQVDYKEFGIPLLHVLVYSVGLYYSIVFSLKAINGDSSGWIGLAFLLIYGFTIVSRHFVLLTVTSTLISYLMIGRVRVKWILTALGFGIIIIYGFGELGTHRMAMILDISMPEAEQYILDSSKASATYRQSNFGVSAYWFWLYMTSPLSNLIETINQSTLLSDMDLKYLPNFLVSELLPQTFSKRIISGLEMYVAEPYLIVPNLNVATGFSASYRYLGLVGVTTFIICNFFIVLALYLSTRCNQTKRMCICFYSTLFLFFVFDNMTAFPSYYVCGLLFVLRDVRAVR